MSDEWQQVSRLWAHIGHPMRPGADDLRVIERRLADPALRKPAPRVIVLGSTPEYHGLPWPADVQLTAVDKSQTMLTTLWPGSARLCADWLDLPLAAGDADLALCDGGLAVLPWPHGQQAFAVELARVLRPGGLAVLRCFTPPAQREPLAAIAEDVLAGKLTRSAARLRIWMALQESPEQGVDNAESWRVLLDIEPRTERLAELIKVDADYLRAVKVKLESRIYHFASAAAVHEVFCGEPGGFRLEEMHVPDYPFGAWCPTHVLRRA